MTLWNKASECDSQTITKTCFTLIFKTIVMKTKNLYFILLALMFIASACAENADLAPSLGQESDQLNAQGSSSGGHWENELVCTTITVNGETSVVPGSCHWEAIWVDLDANPGGSGSGSDPKKKKVKQNKVLTECSYFVAAGLTCAEMQNFQMEFMYAMSDAEWSRFVGMTKEQRSKYVANAKLAENKADQYFPGWTKNSKGDALRQAIASALNAKDLGVSLTHQLQNDNENGQGYSANELQMKHTNEAFGRSLILSHGPTLSAATLCNMVIYARANGGLVYISNGSVVTTADPQGPPGDDCPDGDEGGAGMPIGFC